MGKVVKKIRHAAGSIAHATRNIPGVNAVTSPLALIDQPSDFASIWEKNILPQYAVGGLAGLGVLGAGALGLTGTGALGAAGAGAGLDAAGEAAAAGLGNYSLAGGLGGSSLLGGLGGLLGGAAGAAGSGGLLNYLPLLAQIGGGIYGANASKDASQAQVAAANRAMDLQNQQFLFQQAQQEPFRQAGLTGQNRLMQLLGLTPQAAGTSGADYGKYGRDFSTQDFQQDPGYQFRLSEGLKALDQQAAARGGLISGAALKASQRYGQNAASDEYQNAFNRYQVNRSNQLNPLQALAGQAQSATNTLGQASQNYANQGSNALENAGNARASGYVGQANALTNALGGALGYYQNQQLVNSLPRY